MQSTYFQCSVLTGSGGYHTQAKAGYQPIKTRLRATPQSISVESSSQPIPKSSSQDEWQHMKDVEGASNDAIGRDHGDDWA